MVKEDRHYLLQIDILKTIAIFAVVGVHSTWARESVYLNDNAIFYILDPVPLFFIIMGFNYGLAFKRRNWVSLREMFSKQYFLQRFERFIFPLILIDLISVVLGAINYIITEENIIQIHPFVLIGRMLFPGPGHYFLTILLQFIIVFPILYRLHIIDHKLAVSAGFALDFIFQLIAPYISLFDQYPYLYSACIFRYLSVISMGLWLSENPDLFAKRNWWFFVGLVVSGVYLLSYLLFSYTFPLFRQGTGWDASVIFANFYPAFLFLIGIKYLPAQINKHSWIFRNLSKLTYHIYLVQVAYFYLWIVHGFYLQSFGVEIRNFTVLNLIKHFTVYLLNCITCTMLAYGFYWLDFTIKKNTKKIWALRKPVEEN